MTEFERQDLSGSSFHDVELREATFREVDLTHARFHNVDLAGAKISGAIMTDVDISGDVERLVVNGVDVTPFVEAELNRRYPDRPLMRPTDAEGFRAAWVALERLWPETVGRARRLPPELLDERVDGEWSFIETLRHLVFATDAWVYRAVLGNPSPWHPIGLQHDEMPEENDVGLDPHVHPSLDEVLEVRADRMATVRHVLAELTDERLAGMTEPVTAPGYPPPESYAVQRCLGAIINEEWEHRLFAERDLATLESRTT